MYFQRLLQTYSGDWRAQLQSLPETRLRTDRIMKAIVLLAALFCQSVHGGDDDATQAFSKANAKFTLDFYKAAAALNQGKPFISSPCSVSLLFNMILAGANGTTADEISRTLGYDDVGLGVKEVQLANKRLLGDGRSSVGADIANSVWNSQRFTVSQQYRDILANDFNAKVAELNFANSGATDTINKWVNNATHGKITKLFDLPLDSNTLLVLVNAIYFKESWKTKFSAENTMNMEFRGGNDVSEVPMMQVKSKFGYTSSDTMDMQALELLYENTNLSMVILLPNKDDGLSSTEGILTRESLDEIFNRLSNSKPIVNVHIPKMKLETKFDLIPIMQSLNTTEIFTGSADLPLISNEPGLYVSEAVQKACVEVNEEGTVAAAASGASMSRMASIERPPIDFKADHPFIYLIRNRITNIILFIGRFC